MLAVKLLSHEGKSVTLTMPIFSSALIAKKEYGIISIKLEKQDQTERYDCKLPQGINTGIVSSTFSKALGPICGAVVANDVILLRSVQPENALIPMFITDFGIEMLVRLVQP